MDSDLAGMIAIGAAALALLSLLVSLLLSRRLRRLRAVQQVVTGADGDRTLIEHAGELERRLGALGAQVDESLRRLDGVDADLAERMRGAIAHCAVIRYDAMGEMAGRQSSSVALLDAGANGVVLSSILHREQARLYAKPVTGGSSELQLSPEEQEALDAAMRPGA